MAVPWYGYFLVLLSALLAISCDDRNRSAEKQIPSPSEKYSIQCVIDKSNGTHGLRVRLHLYDSSGQLLDEQLTWAYDPMKWAGKWHPENDIFCIYSSDVQSMQAFTVTSNGKLVETSRTQELKFVSYDAMEEKYGPYYSRNNKEYYEVGP